MTAQGTFSTVFDCMDGRCQHIVGDWCREHFGVEYPDTITVAGIDGVISNDAAERERIVNVLGRISSEKHGSTQAAVVGHSGCAGFVTDEAGHEEAIKKSAQLVKDSGLFKEVVGLFVNVEQKTISEVCRV